MSKKKKMSKKDFDDQFEAFLKESMSSEDSIDSARINKFLEPAKKKEKKPWWMQDDEDDQDQIGTGLSASGKSFLKQKRPPEPENSTPIRDDKTTSIRDTKPETGTPDTPEIKKGGVKGSQKTKTKRDVKTRTSRVKTDASMSKDSLEDISEKSEEDSGKDKKDEGVSIASSNMSKNGRTGGPGFETLDEQAEKDKFFREMERNADTTIDYGQLNKDLSQSATTMSPEGAAKAAATLAALEDIEEDESLKPPPKSQPMSLAEDPSQQKPSMLSKVSLMDSMESTMNTTGSPKVGAGTLQDMDKTDDVDGLHNLHQSLKTGTGGTGFMGTNTSQEIEALHKALREVGLSPTLKNDSQPFDSTLAGNKSNSEMLQKILAGEPETGKQRTVEEVLQEMDQIEKRAQGKHEDHDVQLLSDMRKSPSTPRGQGIERQPHVTDLEEMRGYGLSPIHQVSSRSGFENSHTEDTEMYQPVTQVSIQDRGRSKKKDSKEKKDKPKQKRQKSNPKESPARSLSPKSSPRRWMSPRSSPDKTLDRSRSLSPTKPGSTLKSKYDHIKSSGYGQQSPARPSSAKERSDMTGTDKPPTKPGSARTEKHTTADKKSDRPVKKNR